MSYNYDPERGFQNNPPPNNNVDWGSWIIIGLLLFTAWPVGLILLISKLKDDKTKRGGSYRVHSDTKYRQQQWNQYQSSYVTKNTTQQSRVVYTGPTTSRDDGYKTYVPPQETAKKPTDVKSKIKSVTRSPIATPKSAKIMQTAGWILTVLGAMVFLSELGEFQTFNLSYLFSLLYDLGFLGAGVALLNGSRLMKLRTRRFTKYFACVGTRTAIPIAQLAKAANVKEDKAEKDLEIMVENGMFGPNAYVDNGSDMLFLSQEAASQYFREKNRQAAPKEAEEGFSGILRNIRRANDRIADPTLSIKIDKLEEITAKILKEIEQNPTKKSKASTFLNYYLPTTQKLLDSYADFEEAGIRGENSDKAKAQIEETMDSILEGFEHQLDELFASNAMDIDADIRVMNSMLKRDVGSIYDDFGLSDSGAAVQEMPDTVE